MRQQAGFITFLRRLDQEHIASRLEWRSYDKDFVRNDSGCELRVYVDAVELKMSGHSMRL